MILTILLLILVTASALRGRILHVAERHTFTGRPHAFDGDTIAVAGEVVRMRYIDAPEMGQPLSWRAVDAGELARRHLVGLLGKSQATVTTKGRDIYGRHLGIVTTAGKELNRAMIADGYAVAYYTAPLRYRWLDIKARITRAGLWKQGGFANPYRYRRRKANAAALRPFNPRGE